MRSDLLLIIPLIPDGLETQYNKLWIMLYKYLITAVLTALMTFSYVGYRYFHSPISFEAGQSINFQTKGGEFKFTVIPSKGRDHKMMERTFADFVPKTYASDLKLYRTTSKNYFRIKNWQAYKTEPAWQYEYLPSWKRWNWVDCLTSCGRNG